MYTAEKILRELQRLPEPLAQEVLDFIGYLEAKHGLQSGVVEALHLAQKPAMDHVWDNTDDDIWNDL